MQMRISGAGTGLLAIEPATGHSDAMSGDGAPVDEIPPPAVVDLRRMGVERLARLRDEMRSQGVDGAVLMHGPHVTYATGHVPEAVDASHASHRRAMAIVSASDRPARLHAHDAVMEAASGSAETGDSLWPELDDGAGEVGSAIAQVLGDVTGRRVAVDAVTGAMARAGVLRGAELVDASRVLGPARLVKTEDELACLDQAQRHTERAMVAARAACIPGSTRDEVAGAFLAALRDGDSEPGLGYRNGIDPIFQPMPLHRDGGPRTSTGHVAFPIGVENPVFAEGDLVWVDAGVGWQGYMSDFGCTWVAGRAPSPSEQSLCDRWIAVLEASLAVVGPGVTLGDVARAARTVEPDETPWLPQFYLAHGAGLESAEMPMIGTDLGQAFDDGFELAAGMVLVFEPVIWVDGVGGYRAEEVVAVTDDGWRRLGGGDHYEPFRT
ncbi:MAG: aminopeptidase P family protein [Acidimicrobiaceae bacterium]|nr:aminopeptidase P family protein [Acidimicrobiaceae bacterium]